jgi:hypothetical protein
MRTSRVPHQPGSSQYCESIAGPGLSIVILKAGRIPRRPSQAPRFSRWSPAGQALKKARPRYNRAPRHYREVLQRAHPASALSAQPHPTRSQNRGTRDSTGQYLICSECPTPLPGNASWSPVNESGMECAFDCLAGFYHANGVCLKCTSPVCPPGWNVSACTPFADANCDQPCVDAEKPAFYSHWKNGTACSWECDDGYELRVWDYVMFQMRECAPSGR